MQYFIFFYLKYELGKGSKKKKNLEFSRFSGWVGLKNSIFQIKKMLSKCIKMPKYSFKINLFFSIWGRGLTLWDSWAALHMHIGSARLCILSWKNYVTAKIVHVAANISHVVANILRVTADKAFEEAKCYLPRIFFHFFGIYNGENILFSKIAKKLLYFFHF